MGRLKPYVIMLILFMLFVTGYGLSKMDASRIVKKAYTQDVKRITKSEVVWFKLQPYWSVSYERTNGSVRTVMVDPIASEIYAE